MSDDNPAFGTPASGPDEHTHSHEEGHSHDHDPEAGNWLRRLFRPHAHSHTSAALDPAMATERGIWALKISLVGLLVTALFQVGVVAISGSVALLADTLHNFSDALTAIPLWLAFSLSRRSRDRQFTYGYGRAEDLAGVVIVVMIFASALVIFNESFQKIVDPQPMGNIGWVAAAALLGFAGNELVAVFRIRVGGEIGSAALIADGMHARTDGITSLGVLAGVVGVALGVPLADPLVGFAIGVAILWIVWNAGREMWFRMMDAVDPSLSRQIESMARAVEGVMEVHEVALRWVGHRQRGELHITVNCQMPTYASHRIAEEVRHALFHALPALVDMTVHVDPCVCEFTPDPHLTQHHQV
jgi:cation diffusion facilitator family transporter